MRLLFAILVLGVSLPALAASQPLCALPSPGVIAAASRRVESPPNAAQSPKLAQLEPGGLPEKPRLPTALATLPFVRHVAAAGAAVTDLGQSHRMHAIAARSGDQFMLFEVTPDGAAAVSGAMIDLAPAQLEAIARGNITDLSVRDGLAGFFVRSGSQFQVIYATPDQERLIPGVLWDAAGKDLTRPQVAGIPGAVPTVVVGNPVPGASKAAAPAVAALPLMRKASFGTVGRASAPRLFMLIDPQCIYSMRSWQMLRPYVAAGRVRVSVIPLSVLDYEDHGQSTKSALALLSLPSNQLIAAWQSGDLEVPVSPDAPTRLQANMAIARAIGLKGTPTFVWRKANGSEGRIDGVPMNMAAMVSSVGG